MNLVIDIGNTQAKLATYKDNFLIKRHSTSVDGLTLSSALSLAKEGSIKNAIICSVGALAENLSKELNNAGIFTIELTHFTPVPILNLYKTPETLGKDRLAAAIGANNLYPNENILIIDAGTCIKYDFITLKNEYLGGAISPGIEMRFKALNTFTARLPLEEKPTTLPDLIGQNTSTSIQSGVINGAIAEVSNTILQYKDRFKHLKVIITGGDAPVFENALKNSIFAHPDLILWGLNVILNFNAKK